MRAKSIIFAMENGDTEAWNIADRKLKDPRVHAVNKASLLEAMNRLKDPREPSTARTANGRDLDNHHRRHYGRP
jgi:hypothetical protein